MRFNHFKLAPKVIIYTVITYHIILSNRRKRGRYLDFQSNTAINREILRRYAAQNDLFENSFEIPDALITH